MINIIKNVKISEIFTPNTRSLLKLETQNVISKQNGETTMEFQKTRTFSEIDSVYHRATTIIDTPPYGYSALWLLLLMASPPYGFSALWLLRLMAASSVPLGSTSVPTYNPPRFATLTSTTLWV
jgi:hypothetical protein